MALVAYDCSDESDNECDEEIVESKSIIKEINNSDNVKKFNDSKLNSISDDEEEIVPSSSKSFLPTPHSIIEDVEEDESVDVVSALKTLPPPKNKDPGRFVDLTSLKSQKFKLSTQSKSEEEKDVIKKLNPLLQGRNGLLSVLPAPKNESTSKNEEKTSKPLLPYKFLKSKPMAGKNEDKKSKDVDDEDVEVGSDFFSLSKNGDDDLPEPIDIDLPLPSKKSFSDNAKSVESNSFSMDTEENNVASEPESSNASNNPLNLDEETMQRYFGRKRKGESLDDVQVIDVRQDDILAESKRLLTKQLTEEGDGCSSHRKLGGFSSLSRRKHQITYLAFQAKERELELKNMWAQNRLTKKQTQQKYGF